MLSRVTNRLAFGTPAGHLLFTSAHTPACSRLALVSVTRNSAYSTKSPNDCKYINFGTPKNAVAVASGINYFGARWVRQEIAKRSYTNHSAQPPPAKIYTYEDINKLIVGPHPSTVLIDSREPSELEEQGKIPTAVNIPYKSCPGALGLSKEQFEDTFGFPKPAKDEELIFYCQAGVRSTAAEDLAATYGYEKRGNYKGSFKDWVAHKGKVDFQTPSTKAEKEPK